MNEPHHATVPASTSPSKPKFELRLTAVEFDSEVFSYSLFDENGLLLQVSMELLVDILASAPKSAHAHILNALTESLSSNQHHKDPSSP